MSEFIFYGLIVFFILFFLYHLFKNARDGNITSGTIEKYTRERIALKNKYNATVPIENSDGSYYGHAKRSINKEGVYSKAYYDELAGLKEKCGMSAHGRNKAPP